MREKRREKKRETDDAKIFFAIIIYIDFMLLAKKDVLKLLYL